MNALIQVRALLKAGVDVTFHTGEEPPLVVACRLQVLCCAATHGVTFAKRTPEFLTHRHRVAILSACLLPLPLPLAYRAPRAAAAS
jgi:hypothetical protein